MVAYDGGLRVGGGRGRRAVVALLCLLGCVCLSEFWGFVGVLGFLPGFGCILGCGCDCKFGVYRKLRARVFDLGE